MKIYYSPEGDEFFISPETDFEETLMRRLKMFYEIKKEKEFPYFQEDKNGISLNIKI
jgi:hypothetical protein